MSRIFKRGKTWYIDFEYKGKRIHQSLKTTSRKLAELAQKNTDIQISKKDGNRYSGWMIRSLESTAKKAEIPRFTLHDLRNTFASHLVMEGVDLPTVQKLMGHADISTTMIYAHLAPDHLKAAVNRLNSRLENGTKMAHGPNNEENGEEITN